MRTQVIFLAAVFGMVPMLCAQAPIVMKAARVELPLNHPTQMIDRVACDSDGNIYARVWAGDDSSTDQLPIQEIKPEGELTRKFISTDAPHDSDLAKGIFVSSAGIVYQVARTKDGIYAVGFARDGSVKSTTKLEADPRQVDPWQLAVFNAGGYLLSGLTGKDHRTPYTAVFDASGKLVRNIYEPEDEEARQRAEEGDPEYASSRAGNRFVGFGDVAAGSDGNVYLLRVSGRTPALIYVILPTGVVVRKLHIEAPDSSFVARNLKSHDDHLAIGFNGPDDLALVQVTDFKGKIIASYGVNRHKPDWPALACYDSSGFTFVTTYAEKGLYLLKAKPQ